MHPTIAHRFADHRRREILVQVTRERRAIQAERARQTAPDSPSGPSLSSIVVAATVFLATAGIAVGGR